MTDEKVIRLEAADGRGGFFAVDRRAWGKVHTLGLNACVAYLVMARGTGGDNRTTSWSVNAVETYTGIGRLLAKKAIKDLVQAGFVRVDKPGSRPRYTILLYDELPAVSMTADESAVFKAVEAGAIWVPKTSKGSVPKPFDLAMRMAGKGMLKHRGGQSFEAIPQFADEDTDWIWLPNAIVTGAVDEVPPLEIIRQSQSLPALRVFIELYHTHDIAQGGIHWRKIRETYDRHRVAEQGPYVVWGFSRRTLETWAHAPFVALCMTGQNEMTLQSDGTQKSRDIGLGIFWAAFEILTSTGLVEMVAHLIEGDTEEAGVIHPLPRGNGEDGERAITEAAQKAGMALMADFQLDAAANQSLRLVPVRQHIGNVQLVGMARLRYRPRTRATVTWYAGLDGLSEWVERYENIAAGSGTLASYATSR